MAATQWYPAAVRAAGLFVEGKNPDEKSIDQIKEEHFAKHAAAFPGFCVRREAMKHEGAVRVPVWHAVMSDRAWLQHTSL